MLHISVQVELEDRVRVGLAVLLDRLEDPDHSCGDVVCFIGSFFGSAN